MREWLGGLLLTHWRWVLVWTGCVSVVAFLQMGIDKRRAKKGAWRIRERTLFLTALLFGAPGAVLGMYAFRHKTRHWYFRFGLPAILIAQLVLAGWLVFPVLPL